MVSVPGPARRVKRAVAPYANTVLDRVLRPRGERRFQDAYAAARSRGGPVMVTIGSGPSTPAGWINTDVVWRGRVFLDATEPWPVEPGSVAFAYADNVIEHFRLPMGRRVFQHAFDALAPGGVFRLATPDVRTIAEIYLENGDRAQQGFARNAARGRYFTHPVELIQDVFVSARHYEGYCYDFAALAAELRSAGFDVERVHGGESAHPALRGLESRMLPIEEATALIVEGTKPWGTLRG